MKRSELWVPEFDDLSLVLDWGATKHAPRNWEQKDGIKSSFQQMHDSMFHHLAESLAQGIFGNLYIGQGGGLYRGDFESRLDPLLHLSCRGLMCYTLLKRGMYT